MPCRSKKTGPRCTRADRICNRRTKVARRVLFCPPSEGTACAWDKLPIIFILEKNCVCQVRQFAAMAALLPVSDNQKAIKQVFQNAYGVSLNAPLTRREGGNTQETEGRFREVTAHTPVKKEFLDLMDRVFLPNPYPRQHTDWNT